jgi:hypothetical protein
MEDKDAQIGRLTRERITAQKELAVLTERAKELGKHLATVGGWLREYPGQIAFHGVSTDTRLRANYLVEFQIPDADEIKRLVLEIQKQQLAIIDAEVSLGNLGV